MSSQVQDSLLEKQVNPVLNGEQINYARELIDQRHKLTKTPVEVTWPFLKFICCCFLRNRKPSFMGALKRSLRRKLEVSYPKSELRAEENPFLLLGYGMNSYLQVMLELMVMTGLISLVTIPLMMTFSSFNALEASPGYDYNQYTLGNIGGSDAFCAQATFMGTGDKTALTVDCPNGTVINLNAVATNTGNPMFDVGIIPNTAEVNNYCMNSAFVDPNNCSSNLDTAAIKAFLQTNCVDKNLQKCQITNLKQYLKNQPAADTTSPCFQVDSQLFLQTGCLIPTDLVGSRVEKGLVLGCAAVFIALFIVNYLDYIKKSQENNYVEWDVKTITSGDFTIEFDISKAFFEDWKNNVKAGWVASLPSDKKPASKVAGFREWIQQEMEDRLEKLPNLEYDDEPSVQIACTTLAFNNAEIINLLRERGAAIKSENWEEQKKLEIKINELKRDEFEKLVTPCSVFMTFETEEGYKRALGYQGEVDANPDKYGDDVKKWIGVHEIEIQEASEPSDIIWENRHFTPWDRRKKEILVYSIMTIMLLVSFIIIFVLQGISNKALNKYPLISDCSSLIGSDDPVTMQQSAILSYRTNTGLEAQGKTVSYSKGYLQCFCDGQATSGAAADETYGKLNLAICEDYLGSLFTTMILTNGVMVTIIAINYILKTVTIMMITWIKYDTFSEQMSKIVNGVFIALFFNTGILLLLTNANVSDVAGWLSGVFGGKYYDYSPQWYANVGSVLVSTMLLNAYMPPLYELIANATVWLFQTMDNGWKCCTKKQDRVYLTKTTQIYQYMDLYTNPDYIIHYKYSGLLNVIYVTMLYGLGLPMLFPIAFLSFFIFWATEKWQLAYHYQLPPAMDDKMTVNAMTLLSYTPIMFLFNGFWMLSNRQMFNNEVNQLTYSNEEMSSGHYWSTVIELTQATPMLMIAFAFVVIISMRIFAYDLMSKWGYTISSNVIEVDENLPNFYTAVKLSDADWLVKECEYLLNTYKFMFANEEVTKKMDCVGVPKQPIQGIAWYNLMANPSYVRQFNYIGVDVAGRDDLIVDGDDQEGNDCEQSDMVSILVNLAYVKSSVAKNFEFKAGYSKSFAEDMLNCPDSEEGGKSIN